MGASPLMSLGVKAMTANYAGLQTTGHNIANANVSGYSRQQTDLTTSKGQFTGAGFFGRGVDVTTVKRAHDAFLTGEAASAKALSAMDAARLQQLKQIETIFRPGESGLGNATSELMSALSDLSSQPADLATRRVALARAGDMAARFAEAGGALDVAQATVTATLGSTVIEVNGLAASIAVANQQIAALRGLGQPANDLLDERDRLISRLSTHIKVSTLQAEDGSVAVFVGGGQRLVLGNESVPLRVLQDPLDPSRSAVGLVEGGVRRALDEKGLGGGTIAGLLRFQNNDLVDARNYVGRLAVAVGAAVNDQQQRGLSLQPPLGQIQGSALFSLGPTQALPNAANARDAANNLIGSVALTVVDPAALQASDYDLSESASSPTGWRLTRLTDGTTTDVASGDVVDGVRIDFGAPAPQPGDRFLLQAVARAANGMTRLLDDPRDLAAASPLVATTGQANTGTVGAAALQVTASPLPTPGATTRITFTNDSGAYSWDLLDGAGAAIGGGTGNWTAGQAVPTAPVDFNGFTLQLSGVPRNGDIVNIAPTPASAVASNNGNALSLLALRDRPIVGGRSPTDDWAQVLSDIGVRVQSAQSTADISASVATQTESSRASITGVNLDEEAARLIQYQQGYQAAAKVLQVAQSLFDSLLQVAGG